MMILIILFAVWLLSKQKRTRSGPKRKIIVSYSTPHKMQPTVPAVYDPVKLAKEQDRQRREQERQADRARKEAERKRKEVEKARKEQEAKQAALDRIEWAGAMIDKYSALYDQIETELADNPSLTQYKRIQLQKQLLQLEEKIHKYKEQQDKAYFTAHN